jgi:hypothetical protein
MDDEQLEKVVLSIHRRVTPLISTNKTLSHMQSASTTVLESPGRKPANPVMLEFTPGSQQQQGSVMSMTPKNLPPAKSHNFWSTAMQFHYPFV